MIKCDHLGNCNPNLVWINKIQKRFLCVKNNDVFRIVSLVPVGTKCQFDIVFIYDFKHCTFSYLMKKKTQNHIERFFQYDSTYVLIKDKIIMKTSSLCVLCS